MKILYLECNMGAAGDMLMSALYELLPDKAAFVRAMNSLGLPGVELTPLPARTCGIAGTRMEITVGGAEEESHDVPMAAGEGHIHVHSHGHDHHEHDHGHHCHEHHMPMNTVITTITTPPPAASPPSSAACPCPGR